MEAELKEKNFASEMDLMTTEISNLHQQLEEKDKLLSAYSEHENKITTTLQENDSQNIALKKRLQEEVDTKDAVIVKLNEEVRDKALLAKKLDDEEKLIATISSNLSLSEQNNQQLTTRLAQYEDLLDAEKKMSTSLKSMLDLEKNHAELIEQKERDVVALRNILHEIEERNSSLSAELKEEKKNYFELKNYLNEEIREKVSLTHALSEAKADNFQLVRKLHDAGLDIDVLKHEISQAVTDKTDLSLKLREAESGNKILMENLVAIEDEEIALIREEKSTAAAITNRLLDTEATAMRLTGRVQEEEKKNAQLAQKLTEQEILLLNKITDQDEIIRALSTDLVTLTSEKVSASNSLDQHQIKLKEEKIQNESLRSRLTDKEKEKQQLSKSLKELQTKFSDLDQSLRQKVAQNDNLEQQCNNLRSQLSQQSVSSMDKIGSAFSVLADLRNALSQKELQLSSLSSEVRSLQVDKAHLEHQLLEATAKQEISNKTIAEAHSILESLKKDNDLLKDNEIFLENSLRSESDTLKKTIHKVDEMSAQLADFKTLNKEMENNLQVKVLELSEAQQQLRELVNLLTTNTDEMKALNDYKHSLMLDLKRAQGQVAELAHLLSVTRAEAAALRDSHDFMVEQQNARVHEVTQLISPVSSNYLPSSDAQAERVEPILIASKVMWQDETKNMQDELEKQNATIISVNKHFVDTTPVR